MYDKKSVYTKRLSLYCLIFSLAFAVFVLGPPFLGIKFGLYPLMKIADVLDLFTPLVLLPLYWLLFRLYKSSVPTTRENLLFMVLIAFWVLGQSIHLTANSIGHHLEGMSGTDAFKLTGFYDETLGHYLWHFGVAGLSALFIYRQWRNPLKDAKAVMWQIIPAGILYGFAYFAMVIEGATSPLGVTCAVLVLIMTIILGRKHLSQKPLLVFFLTSYSLALILFAVWGIWQGGLVEFSKAGFI
jgi:hypothetical protein